MNPEKALWQASGVFAPDYPRQSSSSEKFQAYRNNRAEFCDALNTAIHGEMPGYYSVYSFPRGHSRDGNIPKVDCIFIDLDVEGNQYQPDEGKGDYDAWRREMSALLARSRMIAAAILEAGQGDHFRVVLSGHKGLHLYLDFPSISTNNGSFHQFKNGLKSYGKRVMAWLNETAGGVSIDRWVDVDASDLGRLARHPNTIHHGASYDDRTRWCVQITVEEMADLGVDEYDSLTRAPRWQDGYRRVPSTTAGDKVVQAIRSAKSNKNQSYNRSSTFDPTAVEQYEERANDDIELEDIPFITSNKPCIEEFRNSDDAFEFGNASHVMEMSILSRLVEIGVPRDVIHEFFREIPGYREEVTNEQLDEIIGREYSEFNCKEIAERASVFCLGSDCAVYNRNEDIQK